MQKVLTSIPTKCKVLQLIAISEVWDRNKIGSMKWEDRNQTLPMRAVIRTMGDYNLKTINMLSVGHSVAFGRRIVGS